LRRGDGEYRWFLVRTVPLFDEQGNILKWYGVSTDIEDRKRAEVAARDLVDAIPHQIWSAPADGSLDYCNARWRAYMGIGLEELQDDGWQSMLHPEDRDRVLKAWHESVANGTPYEQEERHRGVDGIYRWFLARGVPLRDTEGRIIRWYGTNTDIEDRKRVEEALRESETRFRQVAENISVVFWLSNPEATLLHYVSPAYETIWGRSCDSLYSEPKSWMDSVHPDDRESLAEDERMQATGGRYDHTYRIVRPDGSLRWIRGRAFPVRDESGKLIRVAGIAEDITQRKEAEERLERYTHLLQILSRRLFQVQEEERRHLARELHDEIGQTLTAAKINTEKLRSAMPPDARARLDENTAILDRLLQQTRQISLDLRPPLLDDLGLVPALRWYVDQQAERAGLAAKVSAEPLADDVPAHIQVACFRLAQEAITNVVRHAHASTLTVELSRANSALCFFVRDDGVGFDVAKAQARAERGATLGLLGMKERAALAGGSVRITSSLGKGATVEIFLPVDVAEGAIVSQGTGPSRETGAANIWTRK
jgi:PAS domain S-box-containing protein